MAAPALYGRGEKLYEKFKHALVGQRAKKLKFLGHNCERLRPTPASAFFNRPPGVDGRPL